jgi:hypothetical protein
MASVLLSSVVNGPVGGRCPPGRRSRKARKRFIGESVTPSLYRSLRTAAASPSQRRSRPVRVERVELAGGRRDSTWRRSSPTRSGRCAVIGGPRAGAADRRVVSAREVWCENCRAFRRVKEAENDATCHDLICTSGGQRVAGRIDKARAALPVVRQRRVRDGQRRRQRSRPLPKQLSRPGRGRTALIKKEGLAGGHEAPPSACRADRLPEPITREAPREMRTTLADASAARAVRRRLS